MSQKAIFEEYEHEQASWLYASSKSKDNDNNKFWRILSRLLTWTTSGTGKRKPSGDLPWIVVNLAAKKTRHTTKTLNKRVCFHSLEVKRWRRPAAPWGSVQCCLPLQQPVRACTPWGGSTCDVSWPWPGFYTGSRCLFNWWVGLRVGSTCTLPGLVVWVQPGRSGWFSLNYGGKMVWLHLYALHHPDEEEDKYEDEQSSPAWYSLSQGTKSHSWYIPHSCHWFPTMPNCPCA